MSRSFPSPIASEISALRQQALQHLTATDVPHLTAEPPAELLYQTMLALQQQELHRAQKQIKALQQAAAHTTAAADPTADKFHRLFEYSSDAVFLLVDNHFVDCNAALLALVGETDKQQLLGRHVAEFAPRSNLTVIPAASAPTTTAAWLRRRDATATSGWGSAARVKSFGEKSCLRQSRWTRTRSCMLFGAISPHSKWPSSAAVRARKTSSGRWMLPV
ncbi:PAS domain-containing protein [Hymenobacter qilianensis]|uniref:PAS domain-containing protein n=1 Tax=Hymenobacter qilianensis TaxID=1385715 RepID=A0A7H0GVS5_9BACT|nr:PAS domain-containing protein [Hymenobacter qilianensis]QNP52391.1 PAS domain-containing protein [Hymenobacter qilianensis]